MFENWRFLVIGAGTMGHSIAQVFAMNGFETTIVDQGWEQLRKAKDMIAGNLQTLYEMEEIDQACIEKTEALITYSVDLQSAAANADFVVETIYENADAKRRLFSILDEYCSKTAILTSNTSALNIFEIAQVSNPERLIIAHWCTPPHIMPLVEVVLGPQTSPETAELVKTLLIQVGKKPAMINQYCPGFILNRLGQAIFREACYMVEQGWASAEDIDAALGATYGVRWPFEGPLELRDYIGWDVSLKVGSFMMPYLCTSSAPLGPAVDLVSKGRLGVKTGCGLKDYTGVDINQVQKERTRKIVTMMKAIREL